MQIESGNSGSVISHFDSTDNDHFRFFCVSIALVLPAEHLVRSFTEALEVWCLMTAREGLVPLTAALVYALTAQTRT